MFTAYTLVQRTRHCLIIGALLKRCFFFPKYLLYRPINNTKDSIAYVIVKPEVGANRSAFRTLDIPWKQLPKADLP